MARIVKLDIRNFLGIEHLELSDIGRVTVIEGPNRQGKTSVPKAVEAAFSSGGKSPELIRLGADKAEILLELDGDVLVRRTITEASGSTARVTKRVDEETEATISKPQAYLAALYGDRMRFNPLSFIDLPEDKQRDLLMGLMPITVTREGLAAELGEEFLGVDFRQHGLQVVSDVEKLLYDRRKEANGVAKERADRAKALQEDLPGEDFDEARWRAADVSALQRQIAEAGDAAGHKRQLQQQADSLESEMAVVAARIKELQEQHSAIVVKRLDLLAEIETIDVPDVSDAERMLTEYTDAQATLRRIDEAAQAQAAWAEAQAAAAKLDQQLGLARALPEKLLADADVPIQGLAFAETGVTLNGVSVEHLSDSEKLELGVRIACALAGELKLVCIDGAEKLDRERWEQLMRLADESDVQFFITRVTDAAEMTVTTGGPGTFMGDPVPAVAGE